MDGAHGQPVASQEDSIVCPFAPIDISEDHPMPAGSVAAIVPALTCIAIKSYRAAQLTTCLYGYKFGLISGQTFSSLVTTQLF
jgi:hypothetical protein